MCVGHKLLVMSEAVITHTWSILRPFDCTQITRISFAMQTMGLQNEKVSYRNYRKAARSIFTLIRAFCPPEGKLVEPFRYLMAVRR